MITSKAVITITHNDGKLELDCTFTPTVNADTSYDDHPAAFAALRMMRALRGDAGPEELEVYDDDEEEWLDDE